MKTISEKILNLHYISVYNTNKYYFSIFETDCFSLISEVVCIIFFMIFRCLKIGVHVEVPFLVIGSGRHFLVRNFFFGALHYVWQSHLDPIQMYPRTLFKCRTEVSHDFQNKGERERGNLEKRNKKSIMAEKALSLRYLFEYREYIKTIVFFKKSIKFVTKILTRYVFIVRTLVFILLLNMLHNKFVLKNVRKQKYF